MTDTWTLTAHPGPLSVVRLGAGSAAPEWAAGAPLASVTWTPDETSVICPTSQVPDSLPGPVTGPFSAFEVAGPLDFSLTGVLWGLLAPLADGGVSALTLSTYDTDWILVPAQSQPEATALWTAAGHEVVSS